MIQQISQCFRGITSELYGGGSELRLKQELVLGIGGWRLVQALGLEPEVCHLNEGHAAFAVLERARSYMANTHQPFDVALAITRAGNLFTIIRRLKLDLTAFPPDLINWYLKNYAEKGLSIYTSGPYGPRDDTTRMIPLNRSRWLTWRLGAAAP